MENRIMVNKNIYDYLEIYHVDFIRSSIMVKKVNSINMQKLPNSC